MKIEIISEKNTTTNEIHQAISVMAFSRYPLTVRFEDEHISEKKMFESFDAAKDFLLSFAPKV